MYNLFQKGHDMLIKNQAALKVFLLSVFVVFSCYVIFALPYSFPNKNETASLSYAFGFNNKVSIIGTLMAIFLAYIALPFLRLTRSFPMPTIFTPKNKVGLPGQKEKLFWLYVSIYILISIFCFSVFNNPNFHGEDDFFIRNIDLLQMGKIPYKDFWYHFGPALIYIPLFIKKIISLFEISTRTSYYIFHGLVSLFGLYMLYYLINKFDIEQKYKNLIFAIIALLQINFQMGVQYTVFRTLLPFYFIFLLNDCLTSDLKTTSIISNFKLFILPSLLLIVTFSFFIEVGVAFSMALAVYLFAASFAMKSRKIFFIFCFSLASVLLLVPFLPQSIFYGIFNYIGGGQSFPVFPSPPVLIYLFSLLYSIPILFKTENTNNSMPTSISYATLCVFLMPGAFGRGDPGHIFFYGIGTFIATAAILARTSPKAFKAYMATFTVIFALSLSLGAYSVSAGKVTASLYSKYGKYFFSDEQVIKYAGMLGMNKQKTLRLIEYEKTFSNTNFSVLNNYPSLATPLLIDNNLYHYLIVNGKFIPEYYLYTINIDNENQLRRKIEDLNRNDYVIVPKNAIDTLDASPNRSAENRFLSRLLCFPVKIPDNTPAPDSSIKFIKYIVSRYQRIDGFGQYYVYKNK